MPRLAASTLAASAFAALAVTAPVARAAAYADLTGSYSCGNSGFTFQLQGDTNWLVVTDHVHDAEFAGAASREAFNREGTVDYYLQTSAGVMLRVGFTTSAPGVATLYPTSTPVAISCNR